MQQTLFNDTLNSTVKCDHFIDILSHRAKTQPSQRAFTFLVDGESKEIHLTYKELDDQARMVAARLQALSAKGERALLLYPSGLDFIIAFYGCLYAGVIAVPTYIPRSHRLSDSFQAILEDAKPKVILTTSKISADLKDHVAGVQWLQTDGFDETLLGPDDIAFFKQPHITGDMIAFLQYTSGSTSKPKGVMVSHQNMINNTFLICKHCHVNENSQIVTWLPFHHDMGLSGGILQPIYAGIPAVIMSPLDFLRKPYNWLSAITRYKATFSGGPNFAYELCIRKITPKQHEQLDLSHWKVAINGAEPIRSETIEQFTKTFADVGFKSETFYPCYGLAEATIFVTGGKASQDPVVSSVCSDSLKENRFEEKEIQDNTQQLVGCGYSLTGHKIKIVDPDSSKELEEGSIGEIWVSGPSVTLGYWNQQTETKQTFQAQIKDSNDEDYYLRTGDLGAFYNDELFVTGRLKDMLIIRGQNYYPQDIELTVRKSHPMLTNEMCAAFSIEKNLKEKLVVVQEIKWFEQNGHSLNDIKGDIQQALMEAHGLQLYKVVFVKRGSIPMTTSGKVQRKLCCQLYLDNKFEEYIHRQEGGNGDARELFIKSEEQFRDPTMVS